MSLTTKPLQFYERVARFTTFVDPTNLANKLTHNLNTRKRNVGKDRISTLNNVFKQYVSWDYDPCGDGCSIHVIDQVNVEFIGSNRDAQIRAWEAIKANVDKAIYENNVLDGMPLPLTAAGFVHPITYTKE